MIKCETCLSRTNCQFLATHKNTQVEGCTAFRDEEAYVAKIKAETIDEFVYKLKSIPHIALYKYEIDQAAKEMKVDV